MMAIPASATLEEGACATVVQSVYACKCTRVVLLFIDFLKGIPGSILFNWKGKMRNGGELHVLFVADNGSCEWRADEEELQRALECSLTIDGSKWN
jgi:hypothetical protein